MRAECQRRACREQEQRQRRGCAVAARVYRAHVVALLLEVLEGAGEDHTEAAALFLVGLRGVERDELRDYGRFDQLRHERVGGYATIDGPGDRNVPDSGRGGWGGLPSVCRVCATCGAA